MPAPRTSRPPSYLLARCSASARSTLPLAGLARPRHGFQLRAPHAVASQVFSCGEHQDTEQGQVVRAERDPWGDSRPVSPRVKGAQPPPNCPRAPAISRQPAAAPDCRSLTRRYPALEPHIEDLLPKKGDTIVCKCKDYIQIILDPEGEFMFFQCRNGPFIPTLRLLHKCVAAFVLRVRLATNLTCPHLCPAGSGDTPGWG